MGLIVAIVILWATVAAGQLYCDVVTHLAQKPVVQSRSDLVPSPDGTLRIFTLGLDDRDIRAAFRCNCAKRGQPSAPDAATVATGAVPARVGEPGGAGSGEQWGGVEGAALAARWTCGPDVEVLQFRGALDGWTAAQ